MADNTTPAPAPLPPAHRSVLKGVVGNALAEHGTAVDAPTQVTAAVTGALAELGYGTLLAELDRLRAERDAYCDRVDTLTAVAKGNKRHVQVMYMEVQQAHRERDALRTELDAVQRRYVFDTAELKARVAELEAVQAAEPRATDGAVMQARRAIHRAVDGPVPTGDAHLVEVLAEAAEVMADELQRMGAMTWLYADGIVREHDEKIGQRELAKRLADALLRRMAAEDGDR